MKIKRGATLVLALAVQAILLAQSVSSPGTGQIPGGSPQNPATVEELNRRIEERSARSPLDYRLGAEDVIEVAVFEAPELGAVARLSTTGTITLPLLGPVTASGLTPRQFELALEELLRQRGYMHDPHVTVSVREVRSHGVSVIGAVQKPGVYQLQGSKSLIEVLSLASGLDESDQISPICATLLTKRPDLKILGVAYEKNISVYFWADVEVRSRPIENSERGLLEAIRGKANSSLFFATPDSTTPSGSLAFSGIMIANPEFLQAIPPYQPADLGFDVLPRLAGRMFAYTISDYLVDIGTMENYKAAQDSWPGLRFSTCKTG